MVPKGFNKLFPMTYNKLVPMMVLVGLWIFSCNNNEKNSFGAGISTDHETIDYGKKTFDVLCSSCHNFQQDAIGPNLSGLTRTVESEWIKAFIKSPSEAIAKKDPRALKLYGQYKAMMPDFQHLSTSEMNGLLAYMHTHEILPEKKGNGKNFIQNPIQDTIPDAGTRVAIEYVTQIPASSAKSPSTRINKLVCEKNSGRLFINDLRGKLFELKEGESKLYLDMNKAYPNFIDKTGLGTGFGSFAFHPEFPINGLFYTTHTESAGSKPADFKLPDSVKVKFQWVVTEWKSKEPTATSFSGTQRELMRFDFMANAHGLQEIAFNPNAQKGDPDYANLYIALGDGASVQVGYPKIADHHGTDIWGSILRINPHGRSSTNKKYGIPEDNPFFTSSSLQKEIWAYGFRNPNRISWDSENNMWASDIGQANIEELNKVEPGKYYGWPIREGRFLFNYNGSFNKVYQLPKNDDNLAISYPVLQYDHDEGSAISGGFVAEGERFKGKYIFGDIPTGRLFWGDLENSKIEEFKVTHNGKEIDFIELTGSNRVDLKFGRGCANNIYIFTKADGKIYKITEF